MSDLNTLIISGRLTRDPVARGDGSVAAFSVASNRNYQRNGEWVNETTFIDVTAFGHVGTRVNEKLRKGDSVTVQGRLELNAWTTNDGEKRSQLRLVAATVDAPVFTKKARMALRAADLAEEQGLDLNDVLGLLASEAKTEATSEAETSEPEAQPVASNGQPVEDDDIPF